MGYTFVLAGFLKVVTVGGLALSAPVDAARTAFGKASPYLMVPVGLGMCWLAKQVCWCVCHKASPTRVCWRDEACGMIWVASGWESTGPKG